MKKILLFILLVSSMTVGAQSFVDGVTNYKLYKPSNDPENKGVTYSYSGRKIKVLFFYYQMGCAARLVDEYGNKTDMRYVDPFESGENDFFADYYKDMEYVITQYDFDGDSAAEIVIASRIKDGASTPVGIFVYRLKDGKIWNLKAPQTWWDMKVHLTLNHIKVDANHYGFSYDWTYESGRFVDHGNY